MCAGSVRGKRRMTMSAIDPGIEPSTLHPADDVLQLKLRVVCSRALAVVILIVMLMLMVLFLFERRL